MKFIENILNEKNKILYGKANDIQRKSEEWIKNVIELPNGFQKNMVLADIYYLKTICSLDFDCAIRACEYFEKIPFECFTEEFIKNYITCLKLSYQFQKVKIVLLELTKIQQSFEFQYFCLRELVDDAMVADGAMTKEEYFEYKGKLKELLNSECKAIEKINP